MKQLPAPALAAALLIAGMLAPAVAGEYSYDNRPLVTFPKSDTVRVSPYPAGRRAAAVWNADACWRDCTATCNWRMAACMTSNDADECRPYLDACDRSCQRSCRTRGGPLLGFIDF
jgi:hypothetical protein